MVEKRGASQDDLKGTSEGVHTKASKIEDAQQDLDGAYAEEQRNTLKVRYKKLNGLKSPTKRVQPGP